MNKVNWIIGLGSATTLIGLWFWQKENSYGGELASTLQWVGVAQICAGVAIVLLGLIMREK